MKGCRVLTAEEIKQLLAVADVRDRVWMLTGLTFGTRISEALELTFGDVAGSMLSLKSKKGSENQTFDIPAPYKAAIAELRAYYTAQGMTITAATPLFLSRNGRYHQKPMTRQQASHIIETLCQTIGIEGKVNTHSLRKCFVTKIYELTKYNIAETKKYSRHKSLANLDYYIGTTQGTELVHQLAW